MGAADLIAKIERLDASVLKTDYLAVWYADDDKYYTGDGFVVNEKELIDTTAEVIPSRIRDTP